MPGAFIRARLLVPRGKSNRSKAGNMTLIKHADEVSVMPMVTAPFFPF